MDSGERGMNPVAMTIISHQKEYWPNRGSNQRPPATELWDSPRATNIFMSRCDRINSSLTAVRCFDNGYVGKQPVAWKEKCAEYWLKELQESMDTCTSRRNITEILLKSLIYVPEEEAF